MRNIRCMLVFLILALLWDQTHGMFVQAISAALATIPFTGGPVTMTAGLAAAKLAVGSKLLYYLGLFGSRGKGVPAALAKTSLPKQAIPVLKSPSPQGYSAVPLPYMFGGGGGPAYGFKQPGFPPQSYGGPQFGGGHGFSQAELMQAYAAMQGTGQGQYGGGGGNYYEGFPGEYGNQGYYHQMDYPKPAGVGSNPPRFPYEMNPEGIGLNEASVSGQFNQGMPSESGGGIEQPSSSDEMAPAPSGSNENDVNSFFNFLSEMDDNMCISRLICDIGADPNFLGEFSQNIDNIIGSLEVPPDSRANHYVSIMQQGRQEKGGCAERFPPCTDEAYDIVKSVAPSVGVPSNLDGLNLA